MGKCDFHQNPALFQENSIFGGKVHFFMEKCKIRKNHGFLANVPMLWPYNSCVSGGFLDAFGNFCKICENHRISTKSIYFHKNNEFPIKMQVSW